MLVFCCRLMLMALYNVSISVKGLKYISENPGLLPLIWTLLDGRKTIRKHTSLIQNNLTLVQTSMSNMLMFHSYIQYTEIRLPASTIQGAAALSLLFKFIMGHNGTLKNWNV